MRSNAEKSNFVFAIIFASAIAYKNAKGLAEVFVRLPAGREGSRNGCKLAELRPPDSSAAEFRMN